MKIDTNQPKFESNQNSLDEGWFNTPKNKSRK